jgi:type I restriction enzyme, S subunit
MTKPWPTVRLGEVLRRSEETIELQPDAKYRQITVRLWGKGVVLRGSLTGAEIAASRQMVARRGQFILSRIDARNGALGIVPLELDGAIVTNDFPLFNVVVSRLLPAYLGWMCRTASFVEECKRASEGTTNRVRLQEDKFMAREIPLPPLAEQRRVVARIEELAARIHEARTLRHQAAEEAEALIASAVSNMDGQMRTNHPVTRLEDLARREKGSLRSGPFGSALLHDEFVPEGVPAIGIQDVKENHFELSRKWNVTPEKADELKRYTIKPRDILITVMGTLGRACVVPDEVPRMISTKHVWTISLDQAKAEPCWVSFWINYSRLAREELLGQGTGTAIPGLNGEKLRNLSLPKVPLSEQRRVVSELDALQAQASALKRLQAETAVELDALLPAILDRAFKGEL